jgi:hypothetical protein
MSSCLRALFFSALFLAFPSASPALTFFIDASDSGWYSSAGNHTPSNQNYEVGWENEELHTFFVFDLSTLPASETVQSVTLHAYNPAVGEPNASYAGGYDSPDPSETYDLHQVLLAAATVTGPPVPPPLIVNPAAYIDLGDGPVFGTYNATSADNGGFIDVVFNMTGRISVQNSVGLPAQYVLGGAVSSLTSATGVEEFVFGHTDPPLLGPGTRQLIITMTPEPGTGALVALGLVAITSARRSRTSARRIG